MSTMSKLLNVLRTVCGIVLCLGLWTWFPSISFYSLLSRTGAAIVIPLILTFTATDTRGQGEGSAMCVCWLFNILLVLAIEMLSWIFNAESLGYISAFTTSYVSLLPLMSTR